MELKLQHHHEDNTPESLLIDESWIINDTGITLQAIAFAEKFGEYLVGHGQDKRDGMTTTQIRNFFGEIRKIQMKSSKQIKGDFAMLKPRIVMAKTRVTKDNNKNRIQFFEEMAVFFLDKIDLDSDKFDQQFQNFADLIEAIVAFHKAKGGKN